MHSQAQKWGCEYESIDEELSEVLPAGHLGTAVLAAHPGPSPPAPPPSPCADLSV